MNRSRSRHPEPVRRQRERVAHAVDDRQIEPTAGELYYDPHGCDGDCVLCDPDIYERVAILRRMLVEGPRFSFADRVLAQAGIVLLAARQRGSASAQVWPA